jgi:hypothetical protein
MRRLSSERGQAAVVSVFFIAVLVGMATLVLDVGSWYRADRAAQQAADASALAGAQVLPGDPAQALNVALDYAARNGGGVDAGDITFSSKFSANDTISVTVERPSPGFFARLFDIDSVQVGAKASARATAMSAAKYVAPVVVSIKHPLMPGGKGCNPKTCDPDFNTTTELELINLHSPGSGDAAGAFGLIKLRTGGQGSVGASELASWMQYGFDQNMPLGKYNSVPSAMFNSSEFTNALSLRMNTEILIPIYDKIVKSGSTAEYNIIGWVGFVPTKITGGGSNARIHGHFTKVIWQGIQVTAGGNPAFGARTIALVE